MPRTDLEDGLLTHPTAYVVLQYLRFRARLRPGVIVHHGKPIELCAGQVVVGRCQIARDLYLTTGQVGKALDFLRRSGTIKVAATNRYSVVSVPRVDTRKKSEGHEIASCKHRNSNGAAE